jgi:hypothetical protein
LGNYFLVDQAPANPTLEIIANSAGATDSHGTVTLAPCASADITGGLNRAKSWPERRPGE